MKRLISIMLALCLGCLVSMSAFAELEFILPEEYTQLGTLPIYRAIPRDFGENIQPELFNRSSILSRDDWHVVFEDEAILDWAPEALFYRENKGTFDANERSVLADGSKPVEPAIVPLGALSSAISGLASYTASEGASLERTALTHITLEEAKQTLEALLAKLNMTGYICDYALDMSLTRILALGNDENDRIASGELSTNVPPYDYTLATEADEGFFLSYHKQGERIGLGNSDLFSVYAYVTQRGIVNLALREDYMQGEVYLTPEKLVDYQEVLKALPKEMAASRFSEKLASVLEVRLTYSAIRAAKKVDGMVLTPTWLVIYQDESAMASGYECWAEFNAVDGKLLRAMFK